MTCPHFFLPVEGNEASGDRKEGAHAPCAPMTNRETTGRRPRHGSAVTYDKVDHAVQRHPLRDKAQKAARRQARRQAAERLDDASRPLWVGNIHPGTTEFHLQQLFSDCARPHEIAVSIRCMRGTPLIASDRVRNVWQPEENCLDTVYASVVFPNTPSKQKALSKAGSLIHWNRELQIVSEAGYLSEYRRVIGDSGKKLRLVSTRMYT